MRGGIKVWKRGRTASGVQSAVEYALHGGCDGVQGHISLEITAEGTTQAALYADNKVDRYTVTKNGIASDSLEQEELQLWVDGADPKTNVRRGQANNHENSHLFYDSTINAPKTFSIAALIDADIRAEFEHLQDKIRDRAVKLWFAEMNARRGSGGKNSIELSQIEIVELKHEQSRALDPHIHRHLWLNAKVLGTDGKWSNIDSANLYRFHSIINAEGELAARTDPEWLSFLASKGYTLNDDGEIEQLAHLSKQFSKRAAQVDRNMKKVMTKWQADNPGKTPDKADLAYFYEFAFNHDRPFKAKKLDGVEWTNEVWQELANMDSSVFDVREPVNAPDNKVLTDFDYDFMSMTALAIADDRAVNNNGRFSAWDVKAAVTVAVAKSGYINDRSKQQEVIDKVEDIIVRNYLDKLVEYDSTDLRGVRGYRSKITSLLRNQVMAGWAELAVPAIADTLEPANKAFLEKTDLDDNQKLAVNAVTSGHGLVTIIGAAGAGKTTMLKTANTLLRENGRRMIVVSPTQRAAKVATHEIGIESSSLHKLLYDYGFRWYDDEFGRETWYRLKAGQPDPETGQPYQAVKTILQPSDRLVVDEAGMISLKMAKALQEVVSETGCSVALVGDPYQLEAAGDAGAMLMAAECSNAKIEMYSVHRFRNEDGTENTDYAELTVELRKPATLEVATHVATSLFKRGHIRLTSGDDSMFENLIEEYFKAIEAKKSIAISTATNEMAQQLNYEIQQRRIEKGELSRTKFTTGQDLQIIYEGETIQTRQNSKRYSVSNRDIYTVARINSDGSIIVVDPKEPQIQKTLPKEYIADHVHLAYAGTVHSNQGSTTDVSFVTDDVNISGFYVGMTRGRFNNTAYVNAKNPKEAIQIIAERIRRGDKEVTNEDSRNFVQSEIDKAAKRVTKKNKPHDPATAIHHHQPHGPGIGM